MSDSALLVTSVAGAAAADTASRFERAIVAFGPGIRRIALAWATDPIDADDLHQEILFALWKAFRFFRGECSERTFVFRVAHNRAITHSRRRRHTVDLDSAPQLADPRPDPADELDAAERSRRLMDAVRLLPALQRQAISLHLEGFSNPEIAEILGVSAGNVAVRLARGRSMLRDHLGEGNE